MDTERMIQELRRLEKIHKNDKVFTGQTNWSSMCFDVANRLEEQDREIKRLNAYIKELENRNNNVIDDGK